MTYKFKREQEYGMVTRMYQYLARCILKYLPLSITPNMITVFGFSVYMTACALSFYVGDFYRNIFLGLGMFVHHVADVLDGITARSRSVSSRIGEYLDHGLDTVSCLFMGLTTPIVVGVPDGCFPMILLVNMGLSTSFMNQSVNKEHHLVDSVDIGKLTYTVVHILRALRPDILDAKVYDTFSVGEVIFYLNCVKLFMDNLGMVYSTKWSDAEKRHWVLVFDYAVNTCLSFYFYKPTMSYYLACMFYFATHVNQIIMCTMTGKLQDHGIFRRLSMLMYSAIYPSYGVFLSILLFSVQYIEHVNILVK